jgi:hypothetical protein
MVPEKTMSLSILRSELEAHADSNILKLFKTVINGSWDEEFARIASTAEVSPRDLKTFSLLYLPRLASSSLTKDAIRSEIQKVSILLRKNGSSESHPMGSDAVINDVNRLTFSQISEEDASLIIRKHHYLGASRRNSIHFGLGFASIVERKLCAVLTLSYYDLWHIPLPPGVNPAQTRVISRIFAFDSAPKNAVSYLIGRVTRWLRQHEPLTRFILTYVNPAMGFSGASYRAANFLLYGYEMGTRYCYVDGLYITDRELEAQYGTSNPAALTTLLKDRFEVAKNLPPLHVYARAIHRDVNIFGEPRIFIRPEV